MIKKIGFLVITFMLSCASITMAKDKCEHNLKSGGYIVSDADVTTVKNALQMDDDSIVTLQGQIEKRIKKDKYQFKDNTGNMVVKIEKKVWHGQTVNSSDVVQITGELDKDKDGTTLDVESLIKK